VTFLSVANRGNLFDSLSANDKERIYGLNPKDPSSVSPCKTPFGAAGTFSYSRRTRSITVLDFAVSYSTDLKEWFEASVFSLDSSTLSYDHMTRQTRRRSSLSDHAFREPSSQGGLELPKSFSPSLNKTTL